MKRVRFSIRKKTTLLIVAAGVVILLVSILLYNYTIVHLMERQASEQTKEIAGVVSTQINGSRLKTVRDEALDVYHSSENRYSNNQSEEPGFEDYLSQYDYIKDKAAYRYLDTQLRSIKSDSDKYTFYLFYPDKETGTNVYLVSTSDDDCQIGVYDELFSNEEVIFEDPAVGFTSDLTKWDKYGWLVTSAAPVYDKNNGEIIAYLGVDFSMDDTIHQQQMLLLRVAAIMAAVAVIFCVIALILVNRFLVKPLRKLTDAVSNYESDETFKIHYNFNQLDIHTGDEMEVLADSMSQMEKDVNDHISRLVSTTSELNSTREHAAAMDRLVNMDALTGIRNKRAYEAEMDRLNRNLKAGSTEFGLMMVDLNDLKTINDKYGHEKGDESICLICHLVCRIFQHSPVFRFGGDEFIVVLEQHDLRYVDDLLAEFEKEMEDLKKDDSKEEWEKVSAAAGYAVYDPLKDTGAASVFKRADQAMYRRKKEMGKASRRRSHTE